MNDELYKILGSLAVGAHTASQRLPSNYHGQLLSGSYLEACRWQGHLRNNSLFFPTMFCSTKIQHNEGIMSAASRLTLVELAQSRRSVLLCPLLSKQLDFCLGSLEIRANETSRGF